MVSEFREIGYSKSTWTFAERYGDYKYEDDLSWLTSVSSLRGVRWHSYIPDALGLNERGNDYACAVFQEQLLEKAGVLAYHLFCISAYRIPVRYDHDKIGVDKVFAQINGSGTCLFDNLEVKQFFSSLRDDKFEDLSPDSMLRAGYIIMRPEQNSIGPLMGRMFNYWHCVKQGRLPLFNLRPRGLVQTVTCEHCGEETRRGYHSESRV